MKINWVHFPLHPDTPPEGKKISDLFRGRNVDLEGMHKRMSDEMAAEGLAYGKRTHTYNSRLAQELGTWGDSQDGQTAEALHLALYRAYFVEGRDISSIDELCAIASSVGFDAAEARLVLESRKFSAAVDADWERSHELGVTGVPTFVAQGMGVPGAQPYDVLERLILKATEVRDRNNATDNE